MLRQQKSASDISIKQLIKRFEKLSKTQFGYPVNLQFDYSELIPLFKFHLNNAGDPFDYLNLQLNTKDIERDVIKFFAELYCPSCSDSIWGYVTNGGTEGNLYGIFLAKQKFPNGVLYFSKDTHYSIKKIARILGLEFEEVESLTNGEINYVELENKLNEHHDRPALINLNYGTTVKGAIDKVDKVHEILRKTKNPYYLHVDSALFGMLLPFIKDAPHIKVGDHEVGGVDSIAISGHKFIGSPFACGVVLTRKKTMECVKNKIEYLDSIDSTITGSRNGHAPLIFWHAIKKRGKDGFRKEAENCLKNARYIHSKLLDFGIESNLGEFSNTVYFTKPSEELVKKWQLATQGPYAHVVVMQHLSIELIDKFLISIKKDLHKSYKS